MFTPVKKKLIPLTILALAVILLAWGISSYLSRPTDLGNSLKYVGHENYGGCVLFWCETEGGTTYYFATDLGEEELKTYFKSASYNENQNNEQTSTDKYYSKQGHAFKTTDSNQIFVIGFYNDPTNIEKTINIEQSPKQHLISIDKKYYNLAKSAL